MDLNINLGKLKLKNPIILSSGTCGYGLELEKFFDLSLLGGIVTKSISKDEKIGNPPPRIYEVRCGLLNSIGLENIGIKRFLEEIFPKLREINTSIIVSIFGESISEYVYLTEVLSNQEKISAIELNISCPNIEKGVEFCVDPSLMKNLVKEVKKVSKVPIIVKLSLNDVNIAKMAKVAEDAGCDIISAINTIKAMAIDIKERRPIFKRVIAGLSGPCIFPIALRAVYEIKKVVSIPVIGIGGITTADDAISMLIAGASAVQVGTANFIDPTISIKIIEGIKDYLKENNISKVEEIIGSLKI